MRRGILRHKLDRILLYPARTEHDCGKEEPRIFGQLETVDLDGIEILAYVAKGKPQSGRDRFFPRISHAASLRSVFNLDQVPTVRLDILVEPFQISLLHQIPALTELFCWHIQANRQLSLHAQKHIPRSDFYHWTSLSSALMSSGTGAG